MSTAEIWNIAIMIVYVIATVIICIFNGKSANASRKQIEEAQKQLLESQRQFDEVQRLSCIPFLQVEKPLNLPTPEFEIDLNLSDGENIDNIYSIVVIKNLGNGAATNITLEGKAINDKCEKPYPPLNAVKDGDSYFFQFTIEINQDETIEKIPLTWHFSDLLGNEYSQRFILIFEENDLLRVENDSVEFKM